MKLLPSQKTRNSEKDDEPILPLALSYSSPVPFHSPVLDSLHYEMLPLTQLDAG